MDDLSFIEYCKDSEISLKFNFLYSEPFLILKLGLDLS